MKRDGGDKRQHPSLLRKREGSNRKEKELSFTIYGGDYKLVKGKDGSKSSLCEVLLGRNGTRAEKKTDIRGETAREGHALKGLTFFHPASSS